MQLTENDDTHTARQKESVDNEKQVDSNGVCLDFACGLAAQSRYALSGEGVAPIKADASPVVWERAVVSVPFNVEH